MNESRRLADQLRRALDGDAWHGPTWRGLLAEVDRRQALARPIAGAHTIAEVVAHTITWHEVCRRRLLGESPDVSDEDDWPKPALPDETSWDHLRERLLASGHTLAETVAGFPVDKLGENRPGLTTTWYHLAAGGLQHALYHAGQVALLRKAATGS